MAADDLKTKKRKGASEAAPKPKKQKKSDEVPAAAPSKPAKAPKAVAAPIAAPTTKAKPVRKRAEDFFDDEDPPKTDVKPKKKAKKNKEPVADVALEADDEASKPKAKKTKKEKQPEHTEAPAAEPDIDVDDEEATGVNLKKQKKTKTPKKQQKTVVEEKLEVVADGAAEDDEEDLDDQTAALLAGFESERDESDLEKEDQDLDEDVAPKLTKKQQKALQNIRKDSEPAVVYIGRIPHGFFEPQMKKYFSQFGDITRLRLSRNKKTGASKHYAFIEFRHGEVADIVAKTMNNYIMFGHILQCRVVPSEQVHEDLFKGANQRFKVDPRNKKAGNAMKNGASRAVWANRVERENENRAKKAKALKSEFNYTFEAPAVKPVASVPSKTLAPAEDAGQQLLEDAVPAKATETFKVKQPKKGSKSKDEDETAEKDDEEEQPVAKPKAKKEKKRKSDFSAEQPEETAKAPKAKKAKNAVEEEAETVLPEKKRKTKNADQDGAKPKKAKKAKA